MKFTTPILIDGSLFIGDTSTLIHKSPEGKLLFKDTTSESKSLQYISSRLNIDSSDSNFNLDCQNNDQIYVNWTISDTSVSLNLDNVYPNSVINLAIFKEISANVNISLDGSGAGYNLSFRGFDSSLQNSPMISLNSDLDPNSFWETNIISTSFLYSSDASSTVDFDDEAASGTYTYLDASRWHVGQSFVSSIKQKLLSISVELVRSGTPPDGSVSAILWNATGTYGLSSKPIGPHLVKSDISSNTIDSTPEIKTFLFSGANQYMMEASTVYAFSIRYPSSSIDETNTIRIRADAVTPSHPGNAFSSTEADDGSAWTAMSGSDLRFWVNSIPDVSAQICYVGGPKRLL